MCAAMFLLIAAAGFYFEHSLAMRGVTVTGEIVEIRSADAHPTYMARFTTVTGRVVVAELMTSPGHGAVGDHLDIVYDPQDSETVQPVGVDPYYLQVAIPAVAGVASAAGGAWEYRKVRRLKQDVTGDQPVTT
ncbi:DUF3592 domain-containing protein [Frankia canadensis]|uniref:DUF3592 domain-containing protein n=1 Tax=Frankia canadensis TaxID=1836972 RepID=UPI001FAFE6B9|nr:DUF3592 domain-containing protein [Frankia canadensis]